MSKKVRDCLFAIVCVAIIFCLLGFGWTSEREYKRDVVVVSINENIVHCVDVVGNEWLFESSDEYYVNELLVLCMHDNGTEETIVDDVIQEVERMS